MNRTLTLLQGLPTPYPNVADIHSVVDWVERAGGDLNYITAPRPGYIDGAGRRHSTTVCKQLTHPMNDTSWDITTVDPHTLCSCVDGYNLADVEGQKRRRRIVGLPSLPAHVCLELFAFATKQHNTIDDIVHTLVGCAGSEIRALFPQIADAACADIDDIAGDVGRSSVISGWPVHCSLTTLDGNLQALWNISVGTRQLLADGELGVDDHVNDLDISGAVAASAGHAYSGLHQLLDEFPTPPLTDIAEHDNIGSWVRAETDAHISVALTHDLNAWIEQVNGIEQTHRTTRTLVAASALTYGNLIGCSHEVRQLINHYNERGNRNVVMLPTGLAWSVVSTTDNTQQHLCIGADEPSSFELDAVSDLVDNGASVADAYACITALAL
jgi:hypothetical protein